MSQIEILLIVVVDRSFLDTVAKDISMVAMEFVIFRCVAMDISMVAMEFVIFRCVAMEFVDFSPWLLW